MARPPLALGHHGSVKITREGSQWVARCRVRDLDGVTRRVERWGPTRTAAQRALQDELRQRRGERTELLQSQSRFRDATAVWMGKIAERREDSTADTYRHWLEGLVLLQLGELRLYECDVAQIDAFFTRLEKVGAQSSTRTAPSPRKSGMQQTPAAPSARSSPASCSRPCSTRLSPSTRSASWNASSLPRGTARLRLAV
jgi:hypothetical protein